MNDFLCIENRCITYHFGLWGRTNAITPDRHRMRIMIPA